MLLHTWRLHVCVVPAFLWPAHSPSGPRLRCVGLQCAVKISCWAIVVTSVYIYGSEDSWLPCKNAFFSSPHSEFGVCKYICTILESTYTPSSEYSTLHACIASARPVQSNTLQHTALCTLRHSPLASDRPTTTMHCDHNHILIQTPFAHSSSIAFLRSRYFANCLSTLLPPLAFLVANGFIMRMSSSSLHVISSSSLSRSYCSSLEPRRAR